MKVSPKPGSLGGNHKTIFKRQMAGMCAWLMDETRPVNVSTHRVDSGLLWSMRLRLGFHIAKDGRWGEGLQG